MIDILNILEPLPHNVYDYKMLEEVKADIITSSAVRLSFCSYAQLCVGFERCENCV